MKKKTSFTRSLLNGLIFGIAVIVVAYGFQVTRVNFKETRSEQRLTQLTRIIRALAHPSIFEYDQEEVSVEVPVYLPCPRGEVDYPEPDTSGPFITLDPYCGDAEDFITVRGSKFLPGTQGPINFIPPSGASLTLGNFQTDADGNFEERVKLPKRQPVEEAQLIRVIARQNVGLPHFSPVAVATFEKIIETVFLALLATAFGTLLAIPISFLAARNLMSDIKSPISSVSLLILGWVVGMALGMQVIRLINLFREQYITGIIANLAGLLIPAGIIWFLLRWAIPGEEEIPPGRGLRSARLTAILFSAILIIFATYSLAYLMFSLGEYLMDALGAFGFIGFFIAQSGEMLRMVLPLAAALGGGAVVGGALGNLGLLLIERLNTTTLKLVNLILAALAGAVVFGLVGAGIDWLYQIDNAMTTLVIPAILGGVSGGLLSLSVRPNKLLPIGFVLYTIIRTILNVVRAIEPLIYVIVFVVWVGIGPFAGALALALHTIAALAKLYSEQVESILPGPLEAVTATGANRLQTIVYAVVPQIVPPYISFTMYRWDINVRMSTIIGFAGGGGIGFLLQQNIRLLDYRAAAVQMLAIAIVVATMDYVSSMLRERFV